METESPSFVVVIGTSAGGFSALAEVISQLTEEMDAGFFVVMHLSKQGVGGYLVNQMQKYTSLFCMEVEKNTPIKRGTIYFANPDNHLVIQKNQVLLGFGPTENHWRPSIDVLFRSAAAAYDGHTIGIILTGQLDDGTAGMSSIKRCGGKAIVQNPNEAEYPQMPLSVLKEIEVDYSVPLAQIGAVITKILSEKVTEAEIPPDIIKEVEIAESGGTMDELSSLGKNSLLTCPDCGGVLFQVNNEKVTRYKCHTGHTYYENDLLSKQNKNVESTLWVALRMLEERKKLLGQLAEKNIQRGFNRTAADYTEKIHELQKHVDTLKSVLFSTEKETND